MKPSLFFATIRRESRGSRTRLVFFTGCVALGVACIVGVSSLLGAFDAGLRSQSRELLAGDLLVSSRQPLPDQLDSVIRDAVDSGLVSPLQRSDQREFPTLVSTGNSTSSTRSRLVTLKAVDAAYPLAGQIELASGRTLHEQLKKRGAVVGEELLSELNLNLGDSILIGGKPFEIRDRVEVEPDRLQFSFRAGPRVFISIEELKQLELLQFGSRVRHRALFAADGLDEPKLERLRDYLVRELADADYLTIEIHTEAQPALRSGIDRVERYLGLVALISLLLGCAGVAQIVSTWLGGRQREIAILRCLGFRPRDVLFVFLGAVVLLSLIGSFIGALLGSVVPFVLPQLAPGLIPDGLIDPWTFYPALKGLGLGVGVAVVFGLPPLIGLWRISPVRALRQDVEPLKAPARLRVGALLLLLGGVVAASYFQAGDFELAVYFTGALIVLAGTLSVIARGVVFLARRTPRRRLHPYLRQGLASLGRPAAGTVGAIAALGLGVFIVLALYLVEDRISQDLRQTLPPDAPNAYLQDVQPDQWPSVRTLLSEHPGVESFENVPVAMARLRSVDGKPVSELLEGVDSEDRKHWVLTREQRITWLEEFDQRSNTLVEGEWWSDARQNEVSVEVDFARDLGATVGSVLKFDLQGVPIELVVSSLRAVEWRSFSINFFLVAEPGVLEAAPHFQLVGTRIYPGQEDAVQTDLIASYPNIVVLRVRDIIDRVLGILGQLALGVRLLGSVTIVLALMMLAGSVSAAAVGRGQEVALLKTLGLTRSAVVVLFAVEYSIVGLVGGSIGAFGATIGSAMFLEYALELPVDINWIAPLVTPFGCALFAIFFGLAASLGPLRNRPIASLRGSNG